MGSIFGAIGELGSQVGEARLKSQELTRRDAQDKLENISKQLGNTELEERIKKLRATPNPQTQQQVVEEAEKILGRKLTESEKQVLIFGKAIPTGTTAQLSDEQIDSWAKSLPAGPQHDLYVSAVKAYSKMGEFDKALGVMAQAAERFKPATTDPKNEFEAWRAAFKTSNGRDPNAQEIERWHRQPKEGGATGELGVQDYADQVSSGNVALSTVPAKIRGSVLKYMRENKMQVPPQLPAAVKQSLSVRMGSLDNTISILEDVKKDLDLLKGLPTASLVQLAQSPDAVKSAATRLFGLFQSDEQKARIERLAGNLRSMQEHINVLRMPLGATGFRGREGWEALQQQSVRALSSPGVNQQVINNTLGLLKRLRDLTRSQLYGGENQSLDDALDQMFGPKKSH